ncbi:Major histocompatibility complex class I-related protein, partial [Ophiophagus hannah]
MFTELPPDESVNFQLPKWEKKTKKEDRNRDTKLILPGVLSFCSVSIFSTGFHSWQRVIGCDLSKDGHKRGVYQYGYDGEDFISLDQKTLTWTAVDVRAQVTKRRWEAEPFIAQSRNNFLEKECIELLQKCMVYGEDYLLREGKEGRRGTRVGDVAGELWICGAKSPCYTSI